MYTYYCSINDSEVFEFKTYIYRFDDISNYEKLIDMFKYLATEQHLLKKIPGISPPYTINVHTDKEGDIQYSGQVFIGESINKHKVVLSESTKGKLLN